TYIGDDAFARNNFSGELDLPYSIKHIGKRAFSITGFTKISINLAEIPVGLFKGCSKLETLILGDSVEILGVWTPSDPREDFPGGALEGCNNLRNLTFGKKISTIKRASFKGCSALTGNLLLPQTLVSIESEAFKDCIGLTGLILPQTLVSLGSEAFKGCTGLTGELIFPPTLKAIETETFTNCPGLTGSPGLLNSVQKLHDRAFYNCNNLISGNIVLPESLIYIGSEAFEGCQITGVTLNNTIQHLGNNPFDSFKFSGVLSLPASLRTIWATFANSPSITEVIFQPNSQIESIGAAFRNCTNLTKVTMNGSINPFTLRSTFNNCTNLTHIRLGGTLSKIDIPTGEYDRIKKEDKTFYGCDNIKNIVFENGNEPLKLDSDIFANCSIDSLYLGRTLDTDSKPFQNKSTIKSLTLGGSVTAVNDGDFAGCTGLKSLILEPNGYLLPVTLGSNGNGRGAFADCPIDSLHIGRTISSNSVPDQFKDMKTITKLTFSAISSIDPNTFSGCSGISSLTIPSYLTKIGNNAFAGCTGIKTLRFEDGYSLSSDKYNKKILPKNITLAITDDGRDPFADSPLESLYIGVNLACTVSPFKGRPTLKSVKFGEFVSIIGDDCFAGCTALTDIRFPVIDRTAGLFNSGRKIGSRAFAGCTSLKGTLAIPALITAVEDSAFINCSNITKINIEGDKEAKVLPFGTGVFAGVPADTVTVSRNTTGSPFAGNPALTTITVGDKVTALEPDAFTGCTAISKVTSQATVPPALRVSGFETQAYDSAFLFVPDYYVNKYQAAQGWENFTVFGINEVLAKTVAISPENAELFAGSRMSLNAEVLPENTKNKSLVWSSSDESVATVDKYGTLTAIKPGTVTITATTANRLTASCSITV
ncbi:MAG: leucine-rich repeat protein, partial [Paramuribaculum sp.]|nr:leucine-rich repeat protein [Paramuribaculum sp.]